MLVVVVVALVGAAGAAARRPANACPAGASLYVVAHADDSILFQDPDLEQAIHSGRCVRTVIVTAGDAGLGLDYALSRAQGAMAAYAEIAGVADSWTQMTVQVGGHPLRVATLDGATNVSLLFMLLPDGNGDGGGFTADGSQSLQQLAGGTEVTITAIDGTSSYSEVGLVATLAFEMAWFRPDLIATQDVVGTYGGGDHSDHYAVADLTLAAAGLYRAPYTLVSYEDYGIAALAANLTPDQAAAKQAAWFAYAPYDKLVCQTLKRCSRQNVGAFWSRQYVLSVTTSKGADPAHRGVASCGCRSGRRAGSQP